MGDVDHWQQSINPEWQLTCFNPRCRLSLTGSQSVYVDSWLGPEENFTAEAWWDAFGSPQINRLYNSIVPDSRKKRVLFCLLLWRRIWGSCGELCMMGPQYALRQHLYWLEMVCESGEAKCKISAWFPDCANFHPSHSLVTSSRHCINTLRTCYCVLR